MEVRAVGGLRTFSDQSDSNREASDKLKALLVSIIKEGSELKSKPSSQPFKRVKQAAKPKEVKFEDRLSEAAKDVATHMKGSGVNEAELLDKILFKSDKREPIGNTLLSDVVSDMKVEKDMKRPHKPVRRAKPLVRVEGDEVNLLSGEGLGIFVEPLRKEDALTTRLTVWNRCREHHVSLSVSQPPSNIWEQMIHWTDKGILWQLPVDNEQGLEEEKKTYFADHVFLEPLLDGWCPESGPVRNFMELVCVGLSRNHWLSVEEKRAHINWYRDYLGGKASLLRELGAGDIRSLNPT